MNGLSRSLGCLQRGIGGAKWEDAFKVAFILGGQTSNSQLSGPFPCSFGVIKETSGEGVTAGVTAAVAAAAKHLESLGATVEEVSQYE